MPVPPYQRWLHNMARTMDAVVREMIGALQLQIAAHQIEIENLTEQLAEAKKAAEKKMPLHRVENPAS